MTDKPTTRPKRSHPARHTPIERGHQAIIVFVTVCTLNRMPILACAAIHNLLRSVWHDATNWRVGRYMIMPDHVHLFCSPGAVPPPPLRPWVTYWKSLATKLWPDRSNHQVWQRDCWDTQLRSASHYGEKWEYVRRNPVRQNLVSEPDAWSYQGELFQLMRHDQ